MKFSDLAPLLQRKDRPAKEDLVIRIDGRPVDLSVVRSPRARRFILKVANSAMKIQLTMPARARVTDALDFAHSQSGWISERIALMPDPVVFEHGALVPVRGVKHRVASRSGGRGAVWQETGGRWPQLCVAGEADHLPRRVKDWMKREARGDLDEAVSRYAKALRVRPRRLSLRDQSSRWGSCSAAGTLSFSWRLVLAPPFVLDYVAAHEVAHMREMNHGARFWAHVDRVCPHMEEARDWLRIHGPELHRYGANAG
jgi:hypothetical protein